MNDSEVVVEAPTRAVWQLDEGQWFLASIGTFMAGPKAELASRTRRCYRAYGNQLQPIALKKDEVVQVVEVEVSVETVGE